MAKFKIEARLKNGRGRAGVIETPHGKIETPAFIPVGTKATVKSLSPEQVRDYVGAQAVLANTYHLYLQPGHKLVEKASGLGKFMSWSGPTFTDSGGFQAFSLGAAWGKNISKLKEKGIRTFVSERLSLEEKKEKRKEAIAPLQSRSDSLESSDSKSSGLSKDEGLGEMIEQVIEDEETSPHALAKVDDDGVTFKSVIDGSTHRFTPEVSIEIQHAIGADIIFAFDECASPDADYDYQKVAMDRTHEWAKRCIFTHNAIGNHYSQSLFGIIQGGRFEDLRRESAKAIGSMDFGGFGIGGSFDKGDVATALGWVCDELPEEKPRHLLGIGEPIDLILGIENGADTFDCVAPTRIARNGSAYVSPKIGQASGSGGKGRINLLNAEFISDFSPIDHDCKCYTCENYTRAYVAHLFRAKEMFAATLLSIHNLYFVVNLAKSAREAIIDGKFDEFKKTYM